MPIPFALSLFPKLADGRNTDAKWWPGDWGQEAVHLHETTLATILVRKFGPNATATASTNSASNLTLQSNSQTAAINSYSRRPSSSQPNQADADNQPTTSTKSGPHDHNQHGNQDPLLFLSGDIGANASRARSVELGKDDLETFHNLRAAYHSFSSKWYGWKRPIRIRFYRVSKHFNTNYLTI